MEMFMKRLKATQPEIKLPAVEVIAERRQFSDGVVTLDLLNVSSPHVDEMVVPFIPSDGIVYVADGFTRDFGPWRRPTIESELWSGSSNNFELMFELSCQVMVQRNTRRR
jgi:hypothetical protein